MQEFPNEQASMTCVTAVVNLRVLHKTRSLVKRRTGLLKCWQACEAQHVCLNSGSEGIFGWTAATPLSSRRNTVRCFMGQSVIQP